MENNKNLTPTIIIALAVILSAFFISRTGVSIKSTGGVESNGRISNAITVSGDGQVFAKPDMVQINVGFQETDQTSKEALDKVNNKVDEALKVLKNNSIPDTDITTNNISVNTEYDYSTSTRRIIGQRASQSLTVKVKKIDAKAAKAVKIIDELSAINNLQMNGISFDIEDKTAFFSKARELAFNKAKQKAEELAKLSKTTLTKPISISDSTFDITPVPMLTNVAQFKTMAAGSVANDTQISTGEMGINANLSIVWGME
jgi:uncharacterized protein YggE